jgi:methylmalonyl-CoA/ethylmalonyl-CoA epimerase
VPPILASATPHHFSIAVPDMDRAIEFWTGIFGFRLERRFEVAAIGGLGAFLRSPSIQLELWQLAGAAPVPEERKKPNTDLLTNGTKHIAFQVPDLPAALEALHRHGVAIAAVQRAPTEPMRPETDPARFRPAFAAFIQDPFGTLIELLGPEAG